MPTIPQVDAGQTNRAVGFRADPRPPPDLPRSPRPNPTTSRTDFGPEYTDYAFARRARPAARRFGRAKICPFAQDSFCRKSPRPRVAQLFDEKRVLFRRRRVEQGETSGGRFHLVGGVNIVFYQEPECRAAARAPCRFFALCPSRRRSASASGLISITEFSFLSIAAIRSRYFSRNFFAPTFCRTSSLPAARRRLFLRVQNSSYRFERKFFPLRQHQRRAAAADKLKKSRRFIFLLLLFSDFPSLLYNPGEAFPNFSRQTRQDFMN